MERKRLSGRKLKRRLKLGQRAYEMYKDGVLWGEVRRLVYRNTMSLPTVKRDVKRYTKDNNLPWPLFTEPKGAAPYKMREETGLTWKNIAYKIYGEKTLNATARVKSATRDYANTYHLQWPIINPKNATAYDLRCHHPLYAVALKLGCSKPTASQFALRHAIRHDLPTPWRGTTGDVKRAYQMIIEGNDLKDTAAACGYNLPTTCRNAVMGYAKKNNLPLETADRGTKVKGRAKQAYEMRISTDSTWKEISQTLGYTAIYSSCRCAKGYALKNNLPWPPPRRPLRRVKERI